MSLTETQDFAHQSRGITTESEELDRATDLRHRLIAVLLIAVGAAMLTRPPVALAALVAASLLAIAMGVGRRAALHRLAHVEGFLVVLLLFLPFSTPGEPLFHLGPLSASHEGLALGLLVAAKVNTVALALLSLLGGAAPERLGRALLAMRVPPRFVTLMELILRHSHTARDSLRRQSEAMRARAFRPRSNFHTWRSYGHLFGGALLRAFDRAERVDEAMWLRGAGLLVHAPLPPLSHRAMLAIAIVALVAALFVLVDRLA